MSLTTSVSGISDRKRTSKDEIPHHGSNEINDHRTAYRNASRTYASRSGEGLLMVLTESREPPARESCEASAGERVLDAMRPWMYDVILLLSIAASWASPIVPPAVRNRHSGRQK